MEVSPDKVDEEHLLVHVTAGGAAGALASAVTTPLDVVKTRLQCQGVSGAQRFMSCSVVDAVRRIVAEEGLSALLRGLRPRVLFHTPAAAICWSTYEAGKSFLSDCD
jgi:solute carrier family 25 iron transporter 28/37